MVSPSGSRTAHRDPAASIDRAREIFRDHGVRCTRQREIVYASLASTDTHPTVEDLLLRVRAADPGISQATVYNTLDTLVSCGLAHRIPSRSAGGPCRYDADVSPHVHLTLPDGRVIDAPQAVSEAILSALKSSGMQGTGIDGGLIAGVHIDLTEPAAR
ncbi:MAG: Fur family transcriptional regulator [Planctomycetota bacterium]